MKKTLKYFLILVVVVAIAATGFVVYVYNKPHRNVAKEKAVTLTAEQLYHAFKDNEQQANQLYLDKAIELTGRIAQIATNQQGQTVIDFNTADSMVTINCTFKNKPANIKVGDSVHFKGICTGYIPDMNVVMNNGILVE
ncbi:MAG: hypothetical protein GTN67_08530 [Hydrotalea flava]|uniref:OB-fold protein n=1 Tax=Hydrotalea TaxID=1004300 RepID=UPI0009430265|nr:MULTISPECIES: hypothetical protein [Hydrotalea]MBY0348307.1 OB-fold putative lipoprotein [Hydrotalea flava]NIM35412.1 hypothetical protein [Hydrotalea flava]NIM38271.1 hypothetical protein [Hydrotalea flava]NIN03442.1 hypothetical protein [Hydrotalea flava]NIN15129.1 hypothetical protein [Hydrotalea flava]